MRTNLCILCLLASGLTALHAMPAGSDRFVGTWAATVEHDRSFYTYEITLAPGNRSTVRINNANASQETAGTWSYDGTFFRLNALFRNAQIPHQSHIQWASVLTFVEGNDIFHILGRPATGASDTRFTFVRQMHASIRQDAVSQTFAALTPRIPLGSRVAVVNIAAADPDEGEFFLDEITLRLVNAGQFIVVERRNIEAILDELDFQMTGLVDDNSAVSIGRFLGATVVVTGSISGSGLNRRLVVRALDVLTAEILAMSSVSL